jgi:Cu+-exporting ATPase
MAIPGQGIEAIIAQPGTKGHAVSILAGNRKLMENRAIVLAEFEEASNRLANEGKTPLYVALSGSFPPEMTQAEIQQNEIKQTEMRAAGIIAVADIIKPSSIAAVKKIRQMGIELVMITGDNKNTAEAIARDAGIEKTLSEVLPQDKAAKIKKLMEAGRKVAMVGDGINDAPALVQADIGIAIGSGTDVAMESSDIVLMHNDLLDVPKAILLSKQTMVTIKQNLFWAFLYNVLGIPVAAGILFLFGGPLLNPIFAAAAMSMSSVSVLANALRLKRIKL